MVRRALFEGVRFAAAVVVYIFFDQFFPTANSFAWEAVTTLALAFVVGVLTFIIFDVILGRTLVEGTWQIDGNDAADRKIELPLQPGATRQMHVTFDVSRVGLPFRLIHWLARQPDIRIAMQLKPRETLQFIKQRPPHASVSDSQFTVRLLDGLFDGQVGWIEFTASRKMTALNRDNKLRATATVRTSSRGGWLFRMAVRVDPGLDTLIVRN